MASAAGRPPHADQALADVGLGEHAARGVHELSHGMRQRLVLARGLLVRTPLVYLDEPTVGLDPATAADIRHLIKATMNEQRGQTILLTGHYLPEMDELCDRLAVLHQGRILAIGTPDELKATVSDRQMVTLRVGRWRDEVRDDLAALPPACSRCRSSHSTSARVVFASADPPTLEDAFLALTGGEAR